MSKFSHDDDNAAAARAMIIPRHFLRKQPSYKLVYFALVQGSINGPLRYTEKIPDNIIMFSLRNKKNYLRIILNTPSYLQL